MKVKKYSCVLLLLSYSFKSEGKKKKSEGKFTITNMTVKDYMQNNNRCTKIITYFLNKKGGIFNGAQPAKPLI